ADLVADARHMLAICWAIADLDALATAAAETAASVSAPPDEIADAVAVLLDRKGDAAQALEAAIGALARSERTVERSRGTPAALHWRRVADLAVDAAVIGNDLRLPELLDRRI